MSEIILTGHKTKIKKKKKKNRANVASAFKKFYTRKIAVSTLKFDQYAFTIQLYMENMRGNVRQCRPDQTNFLQDLYVNTNLSYV